MKKNDNNNLIFISNKVCGIKNIHLNITGTNNKVYINDNVVVKEELRINITSNNCEIFIDENTSFECTSISICEDQNFVKIGKDCMFAKNTKIYASDFHSIISLKSGFRTNKKLGVIINNHVWICNDAFILKGSYIDNNSVIGAKSVVNSKIKSNSIASGVPANVVKSKVTWSRYLYSNNVDKISASSRLVENTNIICNIENKLSNENSYIEGWAYLKDFSKNSSKFYLEIFYKNSKKKFVNANSAISEDVAIVFKNTDYSKCRFGALIKKTKKIEKMNIIINNNDSYYYKELKSFREEN